MQLSRSVNIPEDLERARASGDLVVFAGAGVSMGPPAGLPSFKELAEHIGGQARPMTKQDQRTLDGYLGRVERQGVLVQDRARARLQAQGSHTPLHEHLVGLFPGVGDIRIVTTNFDDHFSSAAAAVLPGTALPHYIGPALPPGQRFSGIAQLHGSLRQTAHRLVLTDADFSEAYLADGWASRFLVPLISQRTVLFVGYSLTDPLMQYLIRAIPSQGKWFILAHAEEATFEDERVVQLPFESGHDGGRFSDLNEAMRRWHWYASSSASIHDETLRELVRLGAPTSGVDTDYLRARLETNAGLQAFLTHATTREWFEWAGRHSYLDCLISESADNQNTHLWARWCTQHFIAGDTPPLLSFLRTRSLVVHPALTGALTWQLAVIPQLPPRPVVRQLVALLVNRPSFAEVAQHDTVRLIERLVNDGDHREALALLRAGTRLHLKPAERLQLAFENEDGEPAHELPSLSLRLGMSLPAEDVADFVERGGASLAGGQGERLLSLGVERIQEAYELHYLASASTGSLDWLSYERTAVAPSDQDRFPEAIDVLVLLIRAVLDHWVATDAPRLLRFAEANCTSELTLLRRLALYAYSRCPATSPTEVLSAAIRYKWASDHWIRPEWYLVLGALVPQLSETALAAFIDEVAEWPDRELPEDEYWPRTRFDLAHRLLTVAPESPSAAGFVARERELHQEWSPGDPEGLLSRVTASWGDDTPSPIPYETMIAWDPEHAFAELRRELDREAANRPYPLLGAVQQASKTDPPWGVALLQHMNWDAESRDISEAVLAGLRDTLPSMEAQGELLRFFCDSDWDVSLIGPVSWVLSKWSEGVSRQSATGTLDLLDTAAERVFTRSGTVPPSIEHPGWHERALNHPAGKAALVWLRVAEARDWVADQFVPSVDAEEQRRWKLVLADNSNAGAFARPILGASTDRLTIGDFPWAALEVFPSFDPRIDEQKAAQLWDGRLSRHRWTWSSWDGLRPYFEALLASSSTLVPARGRELGDWMGMLVAGRDRSCITIAQLLAFARGAGPVARRAFVRSVPEHLSRLSPEVASEVWRELLRPYWQERRTNVPVALPHDEAGEFLLWLPAFPSDADAILDELDLTEGEGFSHGDGMIHDWHDDRAGWPTRRPAVVVRMISFLKDRRSLSAYIDDQALELLEAALDAGAPWGDVHQAAERFVPHPKASALISRMGNSPPPTEED